MSDTADCGDALRELHAYLDGELADQTRAAIDGHLGCCPHCEDAYHFHAELRVVIRTKCRNDELPPGLLARLERCFDEDFDGDGRIG